MGEDKTSKYYGWAEIIKTVQTPLGFLVLIVLVVDFFMFLIGVNVELEADQRLIIILGVFITLMASIFLVTLMALYRPEALKLEVLDPSLREVMRAWRKDESLKNFICSGRQREAICQSLVGKWKTETSYSDPDGKRDLVSGVCTIERGKDGQPLLKGHSFDERGKQREAWYADMTAADCSRLAYLFEVPLTPGESSLGVGKVHFTERNGDAVNQMQGNWGVLGTNVSGKVIFERID